jgi:hypothetical protein
MLRRSSRLHLQRVELEIEFANFVQRFADRSGYGRLAFGNRREAARTRERSSGGRESLIA